jgi:hypothetical protein
MFPLLAFFVSASPDAFTTVAEQSGFVRTGRYEEVERFCTTLPKRFAGKIKCETFGMTPEGRNMIALIASADGTFLPAQLQKKSRPTLLIQGGIHAGEIDGKDAGFLLMRALLQDTQYQDVLKKLTLVFVPVFNIDGHERFGAHQRPNQNGPEEGGWRVTAQNLNLNRDYAKAEAPETRAMLGLLNRYDPILYADLHVTDGAKFQHDISLLFEPARVGPAELQTAAQKLETDVMSDLKEQGHLPVNFYPSFVKEDEPLSGFSFGIAPPRFSAAYRALKNRLALVVEIHSWKSYPERVQATLDVCVSLSKRAATDASAWLKAGEAADAAQLKLAKTPVDLVWRNTSHSRPIDFLGYAFKKEDSNVSGGKWLRYDDSKPEVWKVPLFDELTPALTVNAPGAGYLVPAAHARWVSEKLQAHGLRFVTLKAPQKNVAVESFRISESLFGPAPHEGRQTVDVKGAWKADRRDVAAGSLFVPLAQRGATLVLHLFEPNAPDSFMRWGYFNAHLEQKEYMESYVAEEAAREMLKDAKLKAEFEARLKSDTQFAKSPEQRLRFFFSRHPSFDERLNLYPVFRVDDASTFSTR